MFLRRRSRKAPPPSPEVREAAAAVRRVKARDKKVQDSSSEVLSVVRDLRDFQRQNNFVRAIRQALSGESG
jgi:hypothetical protein